MPLTFTVDHTRRRIYTTAIGPITPAHIAQFFSDRITTGVKDYDQIVDITGAQLILHDSDLKPLANDRKASLGGGPAGRTAWVAPTPEQYERALRLKGLLESLGVSVSIFRSAEEAGAWLDG